MADQPKLKLRIALPDDWTTFVEEINAIAGIVSIQDRWIIAEYELPGFRKDDEVDVSIATAMFKAGREIEGLSDTLGKVARQHIVITVVGHPTDAEEEVHVAAAAERAQMAP